MTLKQAGGIVINWPIFFAEDRRIKALSPEVDGY
jgi:hypothetical protein